MMVVISVTEMGMLVVDRMAGRDCFFNFKKDLLPGSGGTCL